jgi:hypothetical protein
MVEHNKNKGSWSSMALPSVATPPHEIPRRGQVHRQRVFAGLSNTETLAIAAFRAGAESEIILYIA